MAVTFRWLMRLFLVLAVLALLGAGLVYYLATRSLPNYNRNYTVSGLSGPVEIVRDSHDVPHIYGNTDQQSFFGLGFVHAQDRLWQMTLLRRTVEGRLSELFGPRTLPIDDYMRRLDLYGLAKQSFQYQSKAAQAALKAYAAGVNAWIRTVNADALGRGAPEFFLFSRDIQPWQPADSLAILRLMALKQSGQMQNEILRARTLMALGGDRARLRDILPDAPGPGQIEIRNYASLFGGKTKFAKATDALRDPLDPVPEAGFAGASNAWAAAPSRTATRSTLLANDPHMNFTAPTIWYLAELKLASGSVIGATIPGMPLVLMGRSNRLGWGLTSSYMDDQDIHIEKVDPNNPKEYLTPDGYKPFITRQTRIRVKGEATVTRTLRWTDNGPVLPPDRYNIGAITPAGDVATLSWTALDPVDRTMTAALRLMHAGTVEQAIKIGRLYTTPTENLILADKKSIAFQMVGKMPNRQAHSQTRGRLPSPGWLEENRWLGYLPYENNPRVINPLGGIVANTNNKTVDRPFPNQVSYFWGDTQRIERLQKLLGSRKVQTRESFIEAQLDTVSFSARSLLPLIARNLWYSTKTPEPGSQAALRQKALNLLANWNGDMNEHMPEPLIYAAWMRSLQQRLIEDELGPLAKKYMNPDPIFLERVFRNTDGAAVWCDVIQTARKETCTEMARASLDTALAQLVKTYGPKIASWRWGDAHQARQDSPVLGKIPLLSWLVNIRQSTSGGDNTLMRGKTKGTNPNPYLNVHGAGYRGVYDFADPDSSVFIISTGQSGNFMSSHYDDLAQIWRRGEYIQMSLDPALARAGAIGISRLIPKRR